MSRYDHGRRIEKAIANAISGQAALAGATDIVVELPTDDYLAVARIMVGEAHAVNSPTFMMHVDGHDEVIVRVGPAVTAGRIRICRRGDAPA